MRETLWHELEELDCPLSQTCEADLLAGLIFDRSSMSGQRAGPEVVPGRHGGGGTGVTRSVILSSVARASGVPFCPFYILQESLALAFKKLYPGERFHGVEIPYIEDLVNQHPLDLYMRWRHQQGLDMEGSYNPMLAAPSVRQKMRTAEGQQVGAINHRAALAPLLPFQLSPNQHFEQALALSLQPLPTEGLPILDDDLRFAASFSGLAGVDLSTLRKCALGLLSEMKRRWEKITTHLRTKQTEAIRTATAQRDIGLTAVLLLLANWGDVTLPAGLCLGLPAVGYAPPYGIFQELDSGREQTMSSSCKVSRMRRRASAATPWMPVHCIT